MTKIYYAGIGSRNTPFFIIDLMKELGQALSKEGLILRSGGADGADLSFEAGCDEVNGKKEIYLPWKGFNSSNSTLHHISNKAYEIAEKYHPKWNFLKPAVKKLQARNCYQVLGSDLETPSSLVVCYTEKGKVIGGTGQALRIAEDYNIPVVNLGDPNIGLNLDSLLEEVQKAIQTDLPRFSV